MWLWYCGCGSKPWWTAVHTPRLNMNQYEPMWINMNPCEPMSSYVIILRCLGSLGLCTPLLMLMAQAERMRPPEPVAGVRALPKCAKIAWRSESPLKQWPRVPSILLMFYDFQSQEKRMKWVKRPEKPSRFGLPKGPNGPRHAEDLLRTVGKKKQAPSHGLRWGFCQAHGECSAYLRPV